MRYKLPIIIVLFIVGLVSMHSASAVAYSGNVRLNNYTNHVLVILVETYDAYGYPQWKEVGELPPNRYLLLYDVPEGTRIGAQSVDKSITFQIMTVKYNGSVLYEVDYR